MTENQGGFGEMSRRAFTKLAGLGVVAAGARVLGGVGLTAGALALDGYAVNEAEAQSLPPGHEHLKELRDVVKCIWDWEKKQTDSSKTPVRNLLKLAEMDAPGSPARKLVPALTERRIWQAFPALKAVKQIDVSMTKVTQKTTFATFITTDDSGRKCIGWMNFNLPEGAARPAPKTPNAEPKAPESAPRAAPRPPEFAPKAAPRQFPRRGPEVDA
ncbi:MAG: hypothetical protein G01um10148_389 [Parcubacteria group bacterium Gr01-1014_8]|nr:MAG: hypothetical protein G01um10148_389 [Parcubacteria group bacterium Gr01-1014_8]